MKHTRWFGVTVLIAAMLATPLSAQASRPPATRDKLVIVQLQDGRQIAGAVGKWYSDVGCYVEPPGTSAYLIHPTDIVWIHDAATGAERDLPVRPASRRRLSRVDKALISAVAMIGGMFLLRSIAPGG